MLCFFYFSSYYILILINLSFLCWVSTLLTFLDVVAVFGSWVLDERRACISIHFYVAWERIGGLTGWLDHGHLCDPREHPLTVCLIRKWLPFSLRCWLFLHTKDFCMQVFCMKMFYEFKLNI